MGKRQIAAMQTRLHVITAAKKLISEKGFENVTIDDIAKEAGVAKGTFYTYFKRKEDVVGEIAHEKFILIEQKSITENKSIEDKIGIFLNESMDYIVETGIKICQQWLKNVVEPQNTDGKNKLLYDLNVIKELLKSAVETGELQSNTPIEALHQCIVYEYYGVVTCWAILDAAFDPSACLKDFCQNRLKQIISEYKTK